MANVLVNDASLADIADAIREKNGTEETYKPAEMGDAVRAIQSGGGGGVGIIHKEFDENNLPTVVDASSVQEPFTTNSKGNMFYRMFVNANANGTLGSGFYINMKDIYLPSWIDYLSQEMFSNCSSLENVYGNLSNVTQIGANAFQNCKALKEAPYMPNLHILGGNAFNRCTALERFCIYYDGLQNQYRNINGTAFANCTNLLDIYVPWSEGEVLNAPWGAANATIHYNTVYDENHEPIV